MVCWGVLMVKERRLKLPAILMLASMLLNTLTKSQIDRRATTRETRGSRYVRIGSLLGDEVVTPQKIRSRALRVVGCSAESGSSGRMNAPRPRPGRENGPLRRRDGLGLRQHRAQETPRVRPRDVGDLLR